MLLKEVLEKTTQFFKDKKIETARLDSEILISSALNLKRIELYLKFEQPLKEEEVQKCRELVKRRSLGEPVAYILGQKDFFNLTFFVNANVLVPRPETEILVEMALDWMKKKNKESYEVLDLGSGSGCIGLSVARNNPKAKVTLMDNSLAAIEVTNKNLQSLNLQNQAKTLHASAREYNFTKTKYDLILANPPYIEINDKDVQESVRKFEPSEALFSGQSGLEDIFSWSSKASSALSTEALMIFEIGSTQGLRVKKHFENLNIFSEIRIIKDLAGLDRFILGEKTNG